MSIKPEIGSEEARAILKRDRNIDEITSLKQELESVELELVEAKDELRYLESRKREIEAALKRLGDI